MQPLDAGEPAVVGPYRLLGRLGSGGMGRVYLGRSSGGRTVAVKIVHPHFALDEEFRARFRREVEAARRVGGAWTAPVLDADPGAAVPWVATGYAAGPSVTAAVGAAGPLPVRTVRALGAGLAEALTAVHELGLVHRDVKPSNVLLTLDGPLLIDFGIARATDGTASLTSTGVSVGSPGYMSPEQILGKGVTGAADVFSLGAVLTYAATGRPPFTGDSSAALLYKVVHERPGLDDVPAELLGLVTACLDKDPGARPAPAELARGLAPDGAARLVAAGWLPGSLVEQVSRDAVRLLNLDAAEGGDAAAAAASAAGPAGFGPPPVMPSGGSGAPPWRPEMPSAPPGPRTPASGTPADAAADPGRRPGKVSVSVAAVAVPETGGRGRRLSCTVALAVAGALAAVTVGSAFLFDLVPGGSGGGSDAAAGSAAPSVSAGASAGGSAPSATASPGSPPAQTATASPTASPSGSATAPGGTGDSVPASYVGTWQGVANALGGTVPVGTFRLTVHRAKEGEKLGTMRSTDAIGGTCDDILTLRTVTATQLVAESVGAVGNHSGCNPVAHTVRITAEGDDLRYASESDDEGRPVARLSRVE
ncbi:protein kinase [Streptomyces sp. NPDC008150]|uniref:serine/threonine-protein kinase n=1 Tax=Streptomyces sp. NPDC008150 TaxID=3364816 RepID=UPI0036E9FFB9